MNYRAKNITIAVGLAALAAILTSVYVVNYKRHVQHGEGKVTVLVAARDIPAGTSGAEIVDQNMLKEQTVPRKAIVAGAISSPDQLSTYVATQDVYEGEQVTTRRFSPPKEQGIRSMIKGTQRAYELSGEPHQLLAGTLKDGDYVDIVGTWQDPESVQHHVSRVILRNLLVMRAPDGTGGEEKLTSPNSGSSSVQLRLTDAQAQKLLFVQQVGEFYLVLRPPAGSSDSANTFQDSHMMLSDGPGRRAR
jgi:Flp pilus assembly protein CpaB